MLCGVCVKLRHKIYFDIDIDEVADRDTLAHTQADTSTKNKGRSKLAARGKKSFKVIGNSVRLVVNNGFMVSYISLSSLK